MEELFPGFIDRLYDKGATECRAGQEATYVLPDVGQLPRLEGVNSELVMQLATRNLIEGTLQGFINQNPAVKFELGTPATSLLVEDGRVIGVQLRDGNALKADLVVDCMGRPSHIIADWLATHGYKKPETSTLSADVSYVSR